LTSEEKTEYQAMRNTDRNLETKGRFSLNFQVSRVNPGHPDAILSFDINVLLA